MHTPFRIAAGLGLLAACLSVMAGQAAAVEVNPPLPTATLVIRDQVTVTVELARSVQEKVRGLSGRPGLKPNHGMLFVYEHSQPIGIWMKDMRFPLDIVWIRGGRVVYIEKDAPPLTPVGPERVYTATGDLVLEVSAGFAAQQKIRVGDRVKVDLTK
jgi:uncharacterized membrane protein (UPF0127 family)